MDQAPIPNTEAPPQKTQSKETEWANLSKEELLKLLKESTEENQKLAVKINKLESKENKDKKDLLRYKSKKNVDDIFNNSIQKKFAMKIAYLGAKYHGYASQPHISETIEEKIFDALKHTLLIKTRESCDYSRCGRTDKGVSSFGNVIALKLRAKKPVEGQSGDQNELDYCKMLNGCLPPEIRILSCTPCPDDFNSRYDCSYRVYKYYFFKGNLDIEHMAKAAKKFIGDFDYRNFCKVDVVSTISFNRLIRDVTVDKIEGLQQTVIEDDRLDLYAFTIKGNAFLWHQIRCMVAVLFMIGKHQEEPEIIDDLLNLEKYPARPQYDMAPEKNLVLYDCVFDKVNFPSDYNTSLKLFQHFKNLLTDSMLDTGLYVNLLNLLSQPEIEENTNGEILKKRYGKKYLEDEDVKGPSHKKIKDRLQAKSVLENVNDLKGKKKEIYLQKLQNIEAYKARQDADE